MAEIRLLDAVTVGQIAAGEVIERPASVVKELVENAVDAGATRIAVNIEQGGAELIEVVDDGAGIPAEQLALAVRRHATSKLAEASDLEAIGTLGFRGEGLASIAAVSQLEILSRTAGAPIGMRVLATAEESTSPEPAASPPGTSVRARSLFAGLPVRREYLRSPSTEFTRISSFLSTFALAYPQITFTLRHEGKDVWVMPQTADPVERLAMVFGRDHARALIPLVQADRSIGGGLRGFVSAPGHDRPDRRMQVLFVNGRLLRSTLMAGAWTGGYSTFAMIGRQPYGVLFLALAPESVDANVHPTKSDVRLRYGTQVADGVRRTIAATLRAHAAQRLEQHVAAGGGAISAMPETSGAALASLFEGAPVDKREAPARRMRVLGQLQRTYILASDDETLLLVDQHAAHERIAYEAIVARAREGAPGEPMLVPHVVELDAAQSETFARALESLREGGLDVEPFGERSYRILATPAGYGSRSFDLHGFIDDLSEEPKQRSVRERIWASLACHSVTVAGEALEVDEMASLLERLQACANPMHCPHGRPTMVRFGPAEIARMFKR